MLDIAIKIDDKRAKDTLNRFRDNLPKLTDRGAEKIADLYTRRIRYFALFHNFEGRLRNELKYEKVKKKHYVVRAPLGEGVPHRPYLWYISQGTRLHMVSLEKHPILKRWVARKGKPLRPTQKYIPIRSKKYRIAQKGIQSAHKQFRKLLKQHFNEFIESKGRRIT